MGKALVRACYLGVVTFALTGCVSLQVTPSTATVRALKNVKVLALEPPPLEVPTRIALQSAHLTYLPKPTIGDARIIGVVSTISIIAEVASKRNAPASPETVAAQMSVEELLRSNEIWMPTNVLADEATSQIAATGRNSARVTGVQPIPGVENRDYTLFLENWMHPLRAWYNSDKSSFDYAALGADRADVVVEVALINYSLFDEQHLLVQVMVKLVDPSTRTTIGRARDWANPEIGKLDDALADNGKWFKHVFAQTGSRLIKKCLTDLGLVTAQ